MPCTLAIALTFALAQADVPPPDEVPLNEPVHTAELSEREPAGLGAWLDLPPWLHASGQSTFILQSMPGFPSRYEGPHSLPARRQAQLSHTYTLYLGVRPVSWLEGFVDPEMIRGNGLNGGQGLAGFTNGEVIRNPSVGKEPYVARAFARITIPMSTQTEPVETGDHQFGGSQAVHRLTLTGGKLATTDLFDTNTYANSTRTQFMNWSFLNSTAYDFAADTRGYTVGAAAELTWDAWTLRVGSFEMPTVANGIDLANNLGSSRGDQVELELRTHLAGAQAKPTTFRVLAYRNVSDAGLYAEALAAAGPGVPDITAVRRDRTAKYGFSANAEQPLADHGDTGLFARAAWNNGQSETFAFTEADASWTLGGQLSGVHWSRPDDRVGLAIAQNFLSGPHRAYLAAGGLGFQLGDGALSAGPESICETYYSWHLCPHADLTGDVQLIANPAFNRDRGPLAVFSARLHIGF